MLNVASDVLEMHQLLDRSVNLKYTISQNYNLGQSCRPTIKYINKQNLPADGLFNLFIICTNRPSLILYSNYFTYCTHSNSNLNYKKLKM